jgi:parvulin-like peptidyl-prolyl isomerase
VLEARYTLRQLYVTGLETASRQAAEALKRRWDQGEDPRDLGEAADAPPGGPVLRGRTPERLTELFGAGFTAVVEAAEVGERHVVASGTGWHVVDVEKRRPRQRASFEEARDRVSVRWKTARLEGLKDAAVARLRARYTVRDATP